MSLDMKRKTRRTPASRKKSLGNTLLGLFVGLVIGVLGAAGVVWYIFKTPAPFSNKSQPSPSKNAAPGKSDANSTVPPLALPGKPGDPIPQGGDSDKPRFDFYKILPGNSEAVPDTRSAEQKTGDSKSKNEKDGRLSEPLYLQTGSFLNAGDADNQKAKLAMMGAEASIQQVMLQDKVWYRVRLGPFRKMEEVSAMRADLAKQGIEAKPVKKD